MVGATSSLSAELEAACVRALREAWDTVNYTHFKRRLRPPAIALSDADKRLGRWSTTDRTIEISRRLVLEQPWGVVVEVLKHEMAHQYISEALGLADESAHGDSFRRVCAELGIDGRASGMPPASADGGAGERVLERVAKLLALAGSTNQHEAELAIAEAQRLILQHNLDPASASARRGYGFRHLGEPTGRVQVHERILGSILGEHFFVEVIWVSVHRPLEGTSGTVLEACGTEANLELAAYVHGFLLETAERLWRAHKRTTGITSDRQRRSYLGGVMRGCSEKLQSQRTEQRAEGLVWVGDTELERYYDARHPRRRNVGPARYADPSAFRAGQTAGRGIVLARPITAGGSAPKLLSPRRA
jgi:hypothetical protein